MITHADIYSCKNAQFTVCQQVAIYHKSVEKGGEGTVLSTGKIYANSPHFPIVQHVLLTINAVPLDRESRLSLR